MNTDPLDGLDDLWSTPPPSNPKNTSSSSSAPDPPDTTHATDPTKSTTNETPINTTDTEPVETDSSLYDTLVVIQDIIKSQTDLFSSLTTRLNTLTENTNSKLEELGKNLEKIKSQEEERKNKLKSHIEKTVEEVIQRVSNQLQSVAEETKKGKERAHDGEKRKVPNKELEALAYPFFSSDKPHNQPGTSRSQSQVSLSRSTPCITTPSTSSRVQFRSQASSSSKKETSMTQIIDLTLTDEDDLNSLSPVSRRGCNSLGSSFSPPSPDVPSPSSTYKSKPMPPPMVIKPAGRSTTSLKAKRQSPTSISDKANLKRTRTAIVDHQCTGEGSKRPRTNTEDQVEKDQSHIIGKKQIGNLPNGKKDIIYLVKRSDKPVSSAIWVKPKDIGNFEDEVLDFMQTCDLINQKDVSFRADVTILPEAKAYWDEKGERKVDDHNTSGIEDSGGPVELGKKSKKVRHF